MNSNAKTIEIPQLRYDDLIRTEVKFNLLRNALEEHEGYVNINEIKKCFAIHKNRKETTNE